MRTITFCLAVIAALAIGTPSQAALIGATSGPDSSFSINMSFTNIGTSDIVALDLDGSTADVGPIVWDSVGTLDGSAGTPPLASAVPGVSGVDTSLVHFTFAPGDFVGGGVDTFNILGADPDFAGDPSSGVTIADLIGVEVHAYYATGSSERYQFVDNPGAGLGLTLAPVPLPAAAPLLVAALAGLGFAGRRRKQKVA